MELGALVAEAFLASAEGTEVLGGLGDDFIVEGEIDSAGLFWARSVGLKYDGGVRRLNMRCEKIQAGERTRDALTLNFLRRLRACVEDWTFPLNIEVGLDSHDCR